MREIPEIRTVRDWYADSFQVSATLLTPWLTWQTHLGIVSAPQGSVPMTLMLPALLLVVGMDLLQDIRNTPAPTTPECEQDLVRVLETVSGLFLQHLHSDPSSPPPTASPSEPWIVTNVIHASLSPPVRCASGIRTSCC